MGRVMGRGRATAIGGWLSIVAALCIWGCVREAAPPQPVDLSPQVDETEGRRSAHRPGFLPWAEDQADMIVVDKTSRRLVLYQYGEPVSSYPVVLGRNPGRKRFEGDRRTPSGLYLITQKRPHPKYDRFLAIDYPNESDLEEYRAVLSRKPGASFGRHIGPGGMVGIHGSDSEILNRLGVNWTFGCVSLANHDVEELYAEVSEGTPVLIRDEQQP